MLAMVASAGHAPCRLLLPVVLRCRMAQSSLWQPALP